MPRITIRLSDEEYSRISGEADIASLTMAELCRRKIFGRTIVAKLPKTDSMAVTALNWIGGLIKQLFARERIDGKTAYDALQDLRQTTAHLRGDHDR